MERSQLYYVATRRCKHEYSFRGMVRKGIANKGNDPGRTVPEVWCSHRRVSAIFDRQTGSGRGMAEAMAEGCDLRWRKSSRRPDFFQKNQNIIAKWSRSYTWWKVCPRKSKRKSCLIFVGKITKRKNDDHRREYMLRFCWPDPATWQKCGSTFSGSWSAGRSMPAFITRHIGLPGRIARAPGLTG